MPKTTKMMKMEPTNKTNIDESHSSKDLSTTTTTSKDTKEKYLMNLSEDFKYIRPMPAFVDKTMLLDTIMLEKYRSVCLTAPQRFGKSVNLSMLKRFWEVLPDKEAMSENRKLFEGTKIEKECPDLVSEHCGKYPIIFLNFRSSISKTTCYGSVLERLRTVVHEAYKEHAYLKSSDELDGSEKKYVKKWCGDRTFKSLAISSEEIELALQNLAKYLVKHHHQQVIVLVDEYDCICHTAIMHIDDIKEDQKLPGEGYRERRKHKATDEINDIIALCMGAIGCLLKSNDNVFRGVLTGRSYLATMGLSTLNVVAYKFQEEHDFTPCYGITSEELKEVLSRKNVSMDSKYDEIKKIYSSYRGDALSTLSVMYYLNNGGNRVYNWYPSGYVVGLSEAGEAFRISAVRSIVSYLLSDLSNKTKILCLAKILPEHIVGLKNILSSSTEEFDDRNVNVFLNFLLEQGFLKSSRIDEDERSRIDEDESIEVQIPNLEIRRELSDTLESFYASNFKLRRKLAALFDEFSKNEDDNKKLLKEISVTLNELIDTAKFNKQNEVSLHHIMFFILFKYSKNFSCFSEIGGGEGRLDLLLLSTVLGIGIIIELKFDKTARKGLKQIIDNKYWEAFADVKYNPTRSEIDYPVFIRLNMCEDQKITLCTLLKCKTLDKCFNC